MKTLDSKLSILFALAVLTTTIQGAPGRDEWVGLANKGDVKAMISLGVMYHTGDGIKADYTKALDWYLMAYAKHDGDALSNIGVLFRDGLGVPKNPKVAYLLFLAVHMEGLGSESTQYRAGDCLSRLSESLKKDEIYEALSYTWDYVDQIVKSRGKNTKADKDVLPTTKRPRIRDNGWWLEDERKKMNFKSPSPWDKIGEQVVDGKPPEAPQQPR